MKRKNKIKIKLNGKIRSINSDLTVFSMIQKLKIPLNKVALELNERILDKRKIKNILLKKNDKLEIVHFIGGG